MSAETLKVLRIGIVRGGRIIEDRVVGSRENITIGKSAGNTFVVDSPDMPQSIPLFQIKADKYHLAFREGMNGRISAGSSDLDFNALRNQGLTAKVGEYHTVPVADEARGQLALGDTTILFQMVAPPPTQVQTKIPDTAQGYWLKSMMSLFTACLAGSAVLHVSTVGYLTQVTVPRITSLENIPDRFAEIIMPKKKKVEPPKEEKKEEGGKEEKKKEEKKEEKMEEIPAEEAPKEAAGKSAATLKKEAAQQKAASAGLLKILGGAGSSAGSAIQDVLSKGGTGGDLDAAMQGIGGIGVATSADQKTALGGSGTGAKASVDSITTGGVKAGAASTGKGSETKVTGKASFGAPAVDGDIDKNALQAYVKQKATQIRACYEKSLKKNPNLKGKLVLTFTILSSGKPSNIDVSGSVGDADVNSCIKAAVSLWRLPKPDGDVEVSFPFVFSPG